MSAGQANTAGERLIQLGRVVGVFGVNGELKLESHTEPRDAIFGYQPWLLRSSGSERQLAGVRGRDTGRNIVARFPDVDHRDQAQALIGSEIWVRRGQLRSEEHTSELQSLMRNSYAVFCLKNKSSNKYN